MPETATMEYPPSMAEKKRGSVEAVREDLENLNQADMEALEQELEALPKEVKEALNEEERRYLALLNKKDRITFRHSLAVGEVANRAYPGYADDLKPEGISRTELVKAALFHDLGKLCLPDCLLRAKKSYKFLTAKFQELKAVNPDFISRRLGRDVNTLDESQIRNLDFREYVTLGQYYAGEKDNLEEIRSYGFDPDRVTFMEALKKHLPKSQELIEGMDSVRQKEKIAMLAGAHHHYDNQSKEGRAAYPLASELLRIADVYQAIVQRRPYDQAESTPIEALHIIFKQARDGRFDREIVRRWIRQALPETTALSDEERKKYDELAEFARPEKRPEEVPELAA